MARPLAPTAVGRAVEGRPPTATYRESPAEELLLRNSSRSSAWADVGLMLLFLVVWEIAATVICGFVAGIPPKLWSEAGEDVERALLLPLLALRCGGVVLIILGFLATRKQNRRSVGLGMSRLGTDILFGILAAVVAEGLIFTWQVGMLIAWPDLVEQMNENVEVIMNLVPNLGPLGILGLTVMVGFYEELLFRGFLMTRLRRGMESWLAAVILSTIVFTALHALDQELVAMPPIAILSLVFSLVTIWRRSLVPAIVGHFLFDLFSFLILHLLAGDAWQ